MGKRSSRKPPNPIGSSSRAVRQRLLEGVRREASDCKRCDLWRHGTQTVFGEGPVDADLMLVGEQPGNVEDIEGHPFVGPAGRILREALAQAGLAGTRHYLTNAVKHFKWEPRGKRRIHLRPTVSETIACSHWLETEVAAVRPRVVVALGATATRALLGPALRVTKDRGRRLRSPLGPDVLVTVHPSSILRVADPGERRAAMSAFIRDLRKAAVMLRTVGLDSK